MDGWMDGWMGGWTDGWMDGLNFQNTEMYSKQLPAFFLLL